MNKRKVKFDTLPKDIEEKILLDRENHACNPYKANDDSAIRRRLNEHDKGSLLRSNFIRDVDKILNCPFYNRYSDKTQVFSLYKNDDITRRSLHVQLVSRVARTIGKALNLNLELIEAISLGHDLGHTPFGHLGERFLSEIYYQNTKRRFYHNLQSVRVLDKIFNYNVTLETLDGIAGHNGEIELPVYHPQPKRDFKAFDEVIEKCYTNHESALKLSPSTLEGCVVRLSDIIAYLGKDRQDSTKTKVYNENNFKPGVIGSINAEIINNISVNVIKNSYGKNYIKLDDEYFLELKKLKRENYERIYNEDEETKARNEIIKVMMTSLYEKLKADLVSNNRLSPIFTHHIKVVYASYYEREKEYLSECPDQIVVDYIASMTDDYFIELYHKLFPNSPLKLEYKGYFE